jgi:5-methylcytosine-specific restriction endonuclease McrA
VGKELRRVHRKYYYRNEYLQSDAWQRKRALVMKRDGYRCVHCGMPATQVHHKRYAKNIGREPIIWLESVCKPCHESKHA